jgi:hypothetical protein
MIGAWQGMLRVLAKHTLAGAFDADQVKLLTPAEDRNFVFARYAPTP